jgi:RNA polymerase sigma factor (sigma-70 family)
MEERGGVETQTDNSLMKRVQAGDTAQLAYLFERHHVPLFQYLFHLSRDRAASEDLVQDVFFRVLKYADSFDPAFPFTVWLYRMARNAYFDSLRKKKADAASDILENFPSDDPLPEEIATRSQDTMFLQEALQKLPEDKREILVLSRFHNLRYADIAQILKCETGTVKVRVYRALKELREKFCELHQAHRPSGGRCARSSGETMYDV